MKKRVLAYLASVDALLTEETPCDWRALRQEHLAQIGFFQHERLVHLIVTCLFALMELIAFALCLLCFSPGLLALCLLLLALLAPYIKHYYLLENSVQKMYVQYDAMTEKLRQG